jgi:hypothetical protein
VRLVRTIRPWAGCSCWRCTSRRCTTSTAHKPKSQQGW